LEGSEGVGVLREFAGEGVEGFFSGVAAGEEEPFVLEIEGALGAVLFAGAEKEGGVAGEVGRVDFAAGDLAEGFLAESGEDGLGDLVGAAAGEGDERVGFVRGAVEATGPTLAGVLAEEIFDFGVGGGGKVRGWEARLDDVVLEAIADEGEDVFLLIVREGEERIRGVVHKGKASECPERVSRHSVSRESGSTRKST